MNTMSFRITSSKWLEAFKASQTFALNQMVRGDQQFQISSQELLVDLYDRWFQWLMAVEKLLAKSGKLATAERAELITSATALGAAARQGWMQDVSLEVKLKTLWMRAYRPAHEAYVAHLRNLPNCRADEAFGMVCERLLGLMQHSLLTLHEVDSMLHKPTERAFISVDDYGCAVYNQQGRDLLSERLRLYQRECAVERESKGPWQVKRYVDSPLAASLLSQLEDSLQLANP